MHHFDCPEGATFTGRQSRSKRRVFYDDNESTGGEVPVDAQEYEEGDTVTVAENSRDLVKEGNTFIGWNTKASGDDGKAYSPGENFIMGTKSVTLYARWTTNPTYTITYQGNGNTAGTWTRPISQAPRILAPRPCV